VSDTVEREGKSQHGTTCTYCRTVSDTARGI
jgi:hypothetical protein